MDPAIVSFRPYQSFMSSGPLQQSQNDMFISPPHLAQQQQINNGQFDNSKLKSSEFSNRNNLMQSSYGAPHGLQLQNGIMGPSQTNTQVCFSNKHFFKIIINRRNDKNNYQFINLILLYKYIYGFHFFCHFFR